MSIAPPPPRLAPPPPAMRMAAPPPPIHLIHAPAPPPPRRLEMCDTECYPDYWLIKFYDVLQPGVVTAEWDMYPGKSLDVAAVAHRLATSTIVTFNGISYDEPMITLALTGADCATMKKANDIIIVGKLKFWEFYSLYKIDRLTYLDHVDLKELAPGVNVSLKAYGGRMASQKLQDLPIKPSQFISAPERVLLSAYCTNDLITTYDLYKRCKKMLDLRIAMSVKYGIDLRSKSDAQIAEAIFKVQLGFKPRIAFWPHGTEFKYVAPEFIKFNSRQLQDVLTMIQRVTFMTSDKDQVEVVPGEVDDNGKQVKIKTGVIMPEELKKLIITIGTTKYKMGIGGLHSQESAIAHFSDSHGKLSDHDVASYYPSLILLCAMYPEELGPRFLEIYRTIYDERLTAKATAQRLKKLIKEAAQGIDVGAMEMQMLNALVEADAKKIVLNGTYGKLGSKYSILFAPDLMLKVTLTGQLSLLMLIDALEHSGIKVVSANTDGIVVKTPLGLEWIRDALIKDWEVSTGLQTEESKYASLYSRDVNNYIAFKEGADKLEDLTKLDDYVKTKGVFAKTGLQKNPTNAICVKAVVEYLRCGKPVMQTIKASTDVREFLTIRNVKGGGMKATPNPLAAHTTKEELLHRAGFIEEFEGWLHNHHRDRAPMTKDVAYGHAVTMFPAKVTLLGKVVRWYYGVGETGCIQYETNGNTVAKSDGAIPLMDLIPTMPPDIDYSRYEFESLQMLKTLGIVLQ